MRVRVSKVKWLLISLEHRINANAWVLAVALTAVKILGLNRREAIPVTNNKNRIGRGKVAVLHHSDVFT